MATNIFNIGQSALQAAMAAQATTSHNISNATTAGYNRQVVVQSTAGGINYGYGFVGQGTQVAEIKRVYNDFLAKQQLASQTTASSLDSYYSQISQLNNLVADTDAGLSPALQDFFKTIQNLAATPNTDASRQGVLSGASTLVARFQSLNDQMQQSRTSVNQQITSTVDTINSYSTQLDELNKAIVKAQGNSGGAAANDLLDQRDQVIANINKYVKVSTVPQDDGSMSVFIGTGQPLVVGGNVTKLVATPSADDVSRLEVGFRISGTQVSSIPDKAFYDGGSLGGLLKYRTETLDVTQNSLGRIATILGSAMNDQQKLGLDQNGVPGTNFFNIGQPTVSGKSTNSATASITTTITNASALTTSDYTLGYNGTAYTITRLSDNTKTVVDPTATPATNFPVTVDGVTYSAPTMAAGDSFKIKPTVNGAAQLTLALNNTQQIAAAAPIVTSGNATNNVNLTTTGNTGSGVVSNQSLNASTFKQGSSVSFAMGAGNVMTPTWSGITPAPSVDVTTTAGVTTTYAAGASFPYSAGATISSGGLSFVLGGTPAVGDSFNFAPVAGNKGTASISAGSVDASYVASPLAAGTKLGFTFNSAATPPGFTPSPSPTAGPVSIKHQDGTTTNVAAGATSIPYVAGDTYTIQGVTFKISGQPANGDQFAVSPNTDAKTDNRNAQLLAGLQTANTIGSTSFQGSYSQLVGTIGNKTNEINVTNSAEKARLQAIQLEQQSESGVNQDEELANMLKNQQAYQAAAKIIQAASDMLNVLFTLGN
ncbi:flagellar hook-associated protein FlgK [Herbaspirillum sp. alder98]|uniref:flagellar hook-associated protein FlgK n=1 Tax=Herbaspirillum sp. alder98 TaxID=2913096 RepID=UPI001CD916E8|nr:flagellar hook-associated protein FlgK [Herbaspirillum sp. alder98]MCA1322605.1 flagellar hook-associated protein FlgK [Herbaspirillum sp. alder98]